MVPYTEEDVIIPWGLLWEFTILMKNYHITLIFHALQSIQYLILNCHCGLNPVSFPYSRGVRIFPAVALRAQLSFPAH